MIRFLRAEIREAFQTILDAITLVRTSRGAFLMVCLLFIPLVLPSLLVTEFLASGIGLIIDRFRSPPGVEGSASHVRLDWLERRVTQEEAEADNESFPQNARIDGIPFGYCNAYWRALIEYMLESDELWYYHSRHESHPEWGYVVIRNGQPVARMQTSPD